MTWHLKHYMQGMTFFLPNFLVLVILIKHGEWFSLSCKRGFSSYIMKLALVQTLYWKVIPNLAEILPNLLYKYWRLRGPWDPWKRNSASGTPYRRILSSLGKPYCLTYGWGMLFIFTVLKSMTRRPTLLKTVWHKDWRMCFRVELKKYEYYLKSLTGYTCW